MDRARDNAMRQVETPRPGVLQHAIALALALAVVAVVLVGFDRFLTSMQKFMELGAEEPAPAATDTMPAYVVPSAPSAPAVAPQDGSAPTTGG